MADTKMLMSTQSHLGYSKRLLCSAHNIRQQINMALSMNNA